MTFTLIMANNFFQNDLLHRESIIEEGMYPQPIGDIGLNRVDVRDIADAVVSTLTQTGHEFHCYPLIGVEVLTGRTWRASTDAPLGAKSVTAEMIWSSGRRRLRALCRTGWSTI
jgi:uncharacterized protein YbjT (DUF2867 family)